MNYFTKRFRGNAAGVGQLAEVDAERLAELVTDAVTVDYDT